MITDKTLRAAMNPLRRAAERVALDTMNGTRPHPADLAVFRDGVEVDGFTVRATLLRKSRVSCGIPAPYSCYEFRYAATHPVHGKVVSGWDAGSFREVFRRILRNLKKEAT